MREVKFRGYCEKDSEWRFGSYCTDGEVHEILTPIPSQQGFSLYASQVDTETIGQYTGLKDKNGVDIYEGDILQKNNNCLFDAGTSSQAVKFEDGAFTCGIALKIIVDSFCPVVIGNIYENPELTHD